MCCAVLSRSVVFLSTSRPISGQAAGSVCVCMCAHISMYVHADMAGEEEGTTEVEEREGEGQRQREGETVEASGRSSLGFCMVR